MLTFQIFLEFSRIENCKVLEISRIIFWNISRKSLEIPRFLQFCFTRVWRRAAFHFLPVFWKKKILWKLWLWFLKMFYQRVFFWLNMKNFEISVTLPAVAIFSLKNFYFGMKLYLLMHSLFFRISMFYLSWKRVLFLLMFGVTCSVDIIKALWFISVHWFSETILYSLQIITVEPGKYGHQGDIP